MRTWFQRIPSLLALAIMYFMPVSAQTWDDLRLTIRRRFPGVRQLTTAELAIWLSGTNRPSPVLLDVRDGAEFSVSHLSGARNAPDTVGARRAVGIDRSRPVVVYCSVGYRSSAMAVKLMQEGYTNVFNLEGSIFAWANEGRPVYRGTNRITEVHPFDAKWGKLLDAKYHPLPVKRSEGH